MANVVHVSEKMLADAVGAEASTRANAISTEYRRAKSAEDALGAAVETKVDKVAGKGLSESDFTVAEKSKLEGIEAGAQVNPIPIDPGIATTPGEFADAKSTLDLINNVASTNSAHYLTADADGTPFATTAALRSAVAAHTQFNPKFFYAGSPFTPTKNDWVIVQADEEHPLETIVPSSRWGFVGSFGEGGSFQFQVSYRLPLTTGQLAALDSGVTAAKIATYNRYAVQIGAKADEYAPSFSTVTYNGVTYTEWTLVDGPRITLMVNVSGVLTAAALFNASTGIFIIGAGLFDGVAGVTGVSPTLRDKVARMTDIPVLVNPTGSSAAAGKAADALATKNALDAKVDHLLEIESIRDSQAIVQPFIMFGRPPSSEIKYGDSLAVLFKDPRFGEAVYGVKNVSTGEFEPFAFVYDILQLCQYFDPWKTGGYAVGEFCSYHDGSTLKLYQCTTAHTGEWIAAHFAERDVSAFFSIANTLLKQTIIDVAGEKVNIGVTAVTQDGVTVTGQTVYVHNGTSADDPVVASIAYNGQPVTLTVDKGIQYFVRISDTLAMHFNPTTVSGYATGDTNVTLTYADVSTVTDLNDIAPALTAINNLATARALLVGKEFPDIWVDYDGSGSGDATPAQVDSRPAWNDPLVITDVQMVEDADGNTHLGAVLTRKYATRYDIVFDAPNIEEATEETAQEGLYYYGLAKGATAPAAGNVTYLDLTAGDTIPYADYERVYKNTLRESFDATTKIVADNNVFRYGHNRYETSAYRQYLNSSAAKGEWWTQQHIGQMKPSSASNYCGYKRGCSAKLLSLIKPVKRRCVPNYVTDGGSSSDQDVGLYTVCDDFFLPCCGEMFGTSNNNEVFFNDEYNYQYTYWRDLVDNPAQAPSDNVAAINDVRKVKRINAKSGTAFVTARLRSAYRGNSYNVWFVTMGGGLAYYNAVTACASVPACVIY